MAETTNEVQELFHRRTGITDNDMAIVGSTAVFGSLARCDLCRLLLDSAVQEFPRNALIFMHGDPAIRFYIVLDGWVKVFRETIDGRETVLHVFGAGESFAEAAIFRPEGYPANATACIDSRVLGVPATPFRKFMAENPPISENFMASVSEKLRLLTRQVEQLSARSATERLAGFLLRLCRDEVGSAEIQLPLEKAVIAARLGMQPETFSRSISKLQTVGVRIEGNLISIADVYALRRVSEGNKAPTMTRNSPSTTQSEQSC
ncbi:MAG: Crp/Fnr family transcriptional regulator [Alphaproteobacteria bacterium]|nr:Crp/Fnr family transcriptional regulator [Alphaproteobacteria bacterium]